MEKKDQPTREQIIQTTCDLMESQGYHATGLSQIVLESGAPKGSLYYYFPQGKEQIAAEAITWVAQVVVERIRSNLAGGAAAAESIRSFIETVAYHVEQSGFRAGGPLTTVALETATTNERLNAACQTAYRALQAAFASQLQASGMPSQAAERWGLFITAAMEGAILLSRTHHSGDPLRQTGELLASAIENELHAQQGRIE